MSMLTNGYTDIHGQNIAPNEAYIAEKKAIPGADMSERTHEELPIYDMPEGRNGGIYGRQEENAGGPEPAEGTGSVPMPWQRKTIYTVETEDGDLLSLGPEELANYAARQRKDGAETES